MDLDFSATPVISAGSVAAIIARTVPVELELPFQHGGCWRLIYHNIAGDWALKL